MIGLGQAMTPNGPIDLVKEVTAESYFIDSDGVLHFTQDADSPPDAEHFYCCFKQWQFVYSAAAMPVTIAKVN